MGGALIEADSNVFAALLKNRPNPNVAKHNVALCSIDGEVSFMRIAGSAQMLSGIVDKYDDRHLERITKEIKEYGGSYEIITMQGARFATIIHNQRIDYLSIDIEGGEMNVLESIDFERYDIGLISIERNYNCADIPSFLKQRGYARIMRLGCDEFYEKRT